VTTRSRGIVEEAFRRKAVLNMWPRIRAIADEFAGDLFVQGSPTDRVIRCARALPYNHDLGLLAVFVELFGGIDRKAHRFRLALVRSVFFIIELDYPSVAVGL